VATLRDELTEFLVGWRSDLSPAWNTFFAGVEPDLEAVPLALASDAAKPVIPGRRGHTLPDAPQGSHVFRAFDGIDPDDVSVLVIGQDPYPRISRATGRAFEDGALKSWTGEVAVSLQRLMQSAVSLRYGRPDLAAAPADWKRIVAGISAGTIDLEAPATYFDRLQSGGVLFVNAGWTLTRFEPGGSPEQAANIAMWKPVMVRLMDGLARRNNGKMVYLLLGNFAGYLERGNPLHSVNESLSAMSAPPIPW
jgi:uracil-DNA glycosylase